MVFRISTMIIFMSRFELEVFIPTNRTGAWVELWLDNKYSHYRTFVLCTGALSLIARLASRERLSNLHPFATTFNHALEFSGRPHAT